MIFGVRNSLSALRAASRSMDVSASNIVNANSSLNPQVAAVLAGSSGRKSGGQDEAPLEEFRPQEVHNVTAPGGGVTAVVQTVNRPFVFGFAPGDPNADDDGLVARPNVDLATELLRVQQAEVLYKASAKVLQAQDRLLGTVVNNRA